MDEIEKKIREHIPQDTYNREFIVKFNVALQELLRDDKALVVFMDAVIPVMKGFAKSNNKTFERFMQDMVQYEIATNLPTMGF